MVTFPGAKNTLCQTSCSLRSVLLSCFFRSHSTKVIKMLIHLLFYNLINRHCNTRLYFNTFCISLFNKLICTRTNLSRSLCTKVFFYKSRCIFCNRIGIFFHVLRRIIFCICFNLIGIFFHICLCCCISFFFI